MSAPKLLYLVTEDWYFVSHRLALARAARDAGYDVCVVTRVDKHGDAIRDAGLKLMPVDFDRSGMHPLREVKTIAQLVQIYREIKPDAVHHVAMKPVLYGAIAARRAKVKGIVNAIMGLGFVFSSESLKARLLRPGMRLALAAALGRRNARVIVQNRDDREMLIKGGLVMADQVRLIRGSGVDLSAYTQTPLPQGRPRVVLPARLLKDKGVGEFVEAARRLKHAGVDAEFVLAGAPDSMNPSSFTDEDISAWVREGVVTCTGWQDDMRPIFASATIVCLPSYREGLPKALLEAAASGRAIVTTDVPGCREAVQDGVNGWLVPARDSVALAATLQRALSDRPGCARLGEQGRKMAEREFSLPSVIAQTIAVYDELARRR